MIKETGGDQILQVFITMVGTITGPMCNLDVRDHGGMPDHIVTRQVTGSLVPCLATVIAPDFQTVFSTLYFIIPHFP
jgi:hypothetical protein